MSVKQDRGRVRTAHDLERKYDLGGQKELMKEMRSAIAKAEQMANNQSGKFETTISVFLEPGEEEARAIAKHLDELELIPDDRLELYDFNNDGNIGATDSRMALNVVAGKLSLANWDKAVKSDVTVTVDMSTPEKIISAKGTNMWGREVELTASELIADMLLDIDFIKGELDKGTPTGKFTTTVQMFLEPGEEEARAILKHMEESELIPDDRLHLYDFNNDGKIGATESRMILEVIDGKRTFANWSGAVKSNVAVTIDMGTPEKVVSIKGTNMWGREVELSTSDLVAHILSDIDAIKGGLLGDISSMQGDIDNLTSAVDEINEEIETLKESSGSGSLPTNKFTTTVQMFLEPGEEEISTMDKHVKGTQTIPSSKLSLYDFNNSGTVTAVDVRMAERSKDGLFSLADWSGAKKTNVTVTIDMSTPEKVVGISGVNMWGRTVELTTTEFIAKLLFDIDSIKSNLIGDIKDDIKEIQDEIDGLGSNTGNSGADFITEQGTSGIWTYEKWDSGKSICRAKYSPGSKKFDPLTNLFCYNTNSVSFLSDVFSSTPSHISITAECSVAMAFCNVIGLNQSSVTWATLLTDGDKGSGDFDVSYYIEVVGQYMVG